MNWELFVLIIYFAAMLGIGVTLFIKSKSANDKDYFLMVDGNELSAAIEGAKIALVNSAIEVKETEVETNEEAEI